MGELEGLFGVRQQIGHHGVYTTLNCLELWGGVVMVQQTEGINEIHNVYAISTYAEGTLPNPREDSF